jgi:hypothetical protein
MGGGDADFAERVWEHASPIELANEQKRRGSRSLASSDLGSVFRVHVPPPADPM